MPLSSVFHGIYTQKNKEEKKIVMLLSNHVNIYKLSYSLSISHKSRTFTYLGLLHRWGEISKVYKLLLNESK